MASNMMVPAFHLLIPLHATKPSHRPPVRRPSWRQCRNSYRWRQQDMCWWPLASRVRDVMYQSWVTQLKNWVKSDIFPRTCVAITKTYHYSGYTCGICLLLHPPKNSHWHCNWTCAPGKTDSYWKLSCLVSVKYLSFQGCDPTQQLSTISGFFKKLTTTWSNTIYISKKIPVCMIGDTSSRVWKWDVFGVFKDLFLKSFL